MGDTGLVISDGESCLEENVAVVTLVRAADVLLSLVPIKESLLRLVRLAVGATMATSSSLSESKAIAVS